MGKQRENRVRRYYRRLAYVYYRRESVPHCFIEIPFKSAKDIKPMPIDIVFCF